MLSEIYQLGISQEYMQVLQALSESEYTVALMWTDRVTSGLLLSHSDPVTKPPSYVLLQRCVTHCHMSCDPEVHIFSVFCK